MSVCNGEVHLPCGVVAQQVLVDRNSPSSLRLSRRFPLGMFYDLGLVEQYAALVKAVDAKLAEKRTKRVRSAAQQQLYLADYIVHQWDLDAYESSLELFGVLVDFVGPFHEQHIDVAICHRSRLDQETHMPVVDRWLEFIDREVVQPKTYRPQWSVTSTILLPVALCQRTFELLCIYVPDVGVLKLLPDKVGGAAALSGGAAKAPPRLRGLLEAHACLALYDELCAALRELPMRRSGHWKCAEVDAVIQRLYRRFSACGLRISYCRLFCLGTVERLFQWIEFVDKKQLPAYTPQYAYERDFPRGAKPSSPSAPQRALRSPWLWWPAPAPRKKAGAAAAALPGRSANVNAEGSDPPAPLSPKSLTGDDAPEPPQAPAADALGSSRWRVDAVTEEAYRSTDKLELLRRRGNRIRRFPLLYRKYASLNAASKSLQVFWYTEMGV
jgi:hypothetical protein